VTGRFDDLRVGDEIPALVRTVTREDVRAYADAGGDQNPLHQDDDVARMVGFDGIIAHGMFTMGHLGACVAGWAGDPANIARFSAQFRVPVFMGEEIVAGGRVRSVDETTRSVVADLWVTVTRDGNEEYAIRKGEAEVRFPDPTDVS
jgi:meromycolic acid (3R)-3-hydroxyacyl-[acyl-carrier protein] dehydratase HadB